MASSPHTSVPKAVQFEATQNDEVRRPDLTTVAIHPYPAGYLSDDPGNLISEIRSHYLDAHETACDEILVNFSKTMTCILRHDNPEDDRSRKVSCEQNYMDGPCYIADP